MGTHVSNVEKAAGITYGGQVMRVVRDLTEAASAGCLDYQALRMLSMLRKCLKLNTHGRQNSNGVTP